jgi:branched-chain amino acid transport system substrate-binding protein
MTKSISRRALLQGTATAAVFLSAPTLLRAAEPINIGGLTPLTGGGAPFGPSIAAALKRTADLVNSQGGVLGGRQINLTVEDDETNPEPSARAAAKLINVNKVSAILGGFSSSVTLGIMPMCQERNIMQMFTSSSSDIPLKDTKRLTFNFQALSDVWGRALGDLGKQRGFKSYALMALNSDFTKSMLDGFTEVVGKDAIKNQPFYYNGGQSSYRAEVEKLIAGNPDAVFIPAYVTDFTSVYKEIFRAGYAGKVMTSSLAITPEFKQAVGSAADGILHGFPIPPLKSPAYKEYLVEAGLKDNGDVQQPYGTAGRDQMSTYLLAVEKAGTTESVAVAKAVHQITSQAGAETVYNVTDGLKALRAGKPINFSGASSSLNFDEQNQLKGRDFALWEIKDGKDVVLAYLNR